MISTLSDPRTLPLGRIVDLVAPGATGAKRKTVETRVARWTQEGIFTIVGATARTGSGCHRLYPLSEVVLITIAHTLHEHGLRVAAIDPIIAALRDDLASRPGRNLIDRALDVLQSGKTKTAGACVISFARIADTDMWYPIVPDGAVGRAGALHEVTVMLNLRLALACLRSLLLEDKAPEAVELRRRRAARSPKPEPAAQDNRPLRYHDLRAKIQAG